jgi:AraC-like DNA-binding protein
LLQHPDVETTLRGNILVQLSSGRGTARGLALSDGARQVAFWSLGMSVLARGRVPPGLISFVVPLRSPSPAFFDRVAARQGTVLAFSSQAEYEGCTPTGFEWASIHLPMDEFERQFHRTAGVRSGIGDQGRCAWRVSPAMAQRFVALRQAASSGSPPLDGRASIPLYVHEWIRLLCHVIGERPDRADAHLSGQAAHRVFVRADEYLRAHLSEPVYVADVCGAAGTNERSLQIVFRRRLGLTPLEYLRTLRLHRARRDLLACGGDSRTSIRTVARRWGLTHPGRFSIAYREQFAELPSETLRRRPAGPVA